MLHAILGILKVIGILLLALIGLLLLMVLSLLFVPVRYQIAGKKAEQNLEGQVRITWLLSAVGLKADCSRERWCLQLKLFGVTIKRFGDSQEKSFSPKKKRRKRKNLVKKASNSRKPNEPLEKRKETDRRWKTPEEKTEKSIRKDEALSQKKDLRKEDEAFSQKICSLKEKRSEEEAAEEKLTKREVGAGKKRKADGLRMRFRKMCERFEKLWNQMLFLPERVLSFWEKIQRFFEEKENALERLKKKKEAFLAWIEPFLTEESKALYQRLFGYLKKMKKHYAPRKLEGWMRYGTGAPDITGQLTGFLYLVLPVSAEKFQLLPEFTETVFETEFFMKGHIRACHLAKTAYLLWRDKQLKRLIRRMRAKGGKEDGR